MHKIIHQISSKNNQISCYKSQISAKKKPNNNWKKWKGQFCDRYEGAARLIERLIWQILELIREVSSQLIKWQGAWNSRNKREWQFAPCPTLRREFGPFQSLTFCKQKQWKRSWWRRASAAIWRPSPKSSESKTWKVKSEFLYVFNM